MKTRNDVIKEQWAAMPAGERTLIRAMMALIRSAVRSPEREIAAAGRLWEGVMRFRIRMTVMNRK